MLVVETLDEARAARIDMPSITDPYWPPKLREAAGNCYVQVGLLGIGWGHSSPRKMTCAKPPS